MLVPKKKKNCDECGKEFESRSHNKRFCTRTCNRKFYSCVYAKATIVPVNGDVKGAIGELRVSADLLSRGYEVYRSVSQACASDLVVRKDGVMRTIEVRTAL